MTFKLNISEKSGKTYKLETESEAFLDKTLKEEIEGKNISPDLKGYEFEITGASDKSGFPALENVEGIGLKKVLLTYGKGMKKRPRKEGKKKLSNKTPKGLRLRKSVRGKVISPEIMQINLKVIKEGEKKLSEIFPEQNKPKEVEQAEKKPVEMQTQAPAETSPAQETSIEPAPKEEVKKEIKQEEKPKEKND